MPFPATTTLREIVAALADQIRDGIEAALAGVQVEPRWVVTPTPPTVDMFPADPFLEQTAYGADSQEATFIVRARVSPADAVAGQELLYDLLDPRRPESVAAAVVGDSTIGGTVGSSRVELPSGFRPYADAGGRGDLIGCEWRVVVVL
jgi:hypothetical protein